MLMARFRPRGDKSGYSLIELLIYVAIFAVSAVFLTAILLTITKIQTRQNSVNDVNQQVSFVASTIQQLVQQSSLIDMTSGSATSTLKLRMASSTLDPTLVYASGTAIYLSEGTLIPSSTPVAITNSDVNVGSFSVTKYESPGGLALVQLSLTMTYNSGNPSAQLTRSLNTAIARVSAANFDSSVYPTAVSSTLTLGTASYPWYTGYFNGTVSIGGQYGQIGLGTSPSASTNVLLKAAGNIGFSASTYGLILVSAGGTCYQLGVSNSGAITTSTVTCP
jgi:Tfp pilus assembly protein FimT